MKTTSGKLRSGKGSRDENFPVASWLIKPQHRPAILAFYDLSALPTTLPTTPH